MSLERPLEFKTYNDEEKNFVQAVEVTHELVRSLPSAGDNPEQFGPGVAVYNHRNQCVHGSVGDWIVKSPNGGLDLVPKNEFYLRFLKHKEKVVPAVEKSSQRKETVVASSDDNKIVQFKKQEKPDAFLK